MPTYRLTLEYQGTRYSGWQAQKNAVAVSNLVYKAAQGVFNKVTEIHGAGRTDAGVHALGQVAHLRADRTRKPRVNLKLALNDLLPGDIAVTEAREAPEAFHARYSAKERIYLYQILRRRAAFGSELSWWIKDKLDIKAMAEAAKGLQGMHNFTSFSEPDPEKEKISSLSLRKIEIVESGTLLLLRFQADHFLWKMVRRLTGYLAEVGRGRYKPSDTLRLLETPSRELAPFTAPPNGLFLEKVLYGEERFTAPLAPVLRLF